ncbi:hypothetical protein F4861DRAFT_537900 [Xylaria intraflava]|nr:hypothetical protein F4861DRAFT_537900 [Xylaria intraflava]
MAQFPSVEWYQAPPSDSSSDGDNCPHLKLDPTEHIMDEHGDMLIFVGKPKCNVDTCEQGGDKTPNQVCFKVNSITVASTSPTLGLIVYSPRGIVTGQPAQWHVDLLEDDPQSMVIFMNILYDRFPTSPVDIHMDLERLLKLTVLANKYNIVPYLAKWSAQWIREMKCYWVGRTFIKQSTEDLESLLWIFWVLGDAPLYSQMILQLAFHSELDTRQQLTDPAEQLCFVNELRELPTPPQAIDEIKQTRQQALMAIRKDIKITLEDHLHGNRDKLDHCTRVDGRDDYGWRHSILRLFVNMLQKQNLWPVPYADELTVSPRSLIELFRANPNIPHFVHRFDDSACDAEGTFWEHIEVILREEIRFTPGERTATHLKNQAEKSGLAEYLHLGDSELSAEKDSWTLKEIREFQDAIHIARRVPSKEWPFWF